MRAHLLALTITALIASLAPPAAAHGGRYSRSGAVSLSGGGGGGSGGRQAGPTPIEESQKPIWRNWWERALDEWLPTPTRVGEGWTDEVEAAIQKTLLAALGDRNLEVRDAAALAIGRAGGPGARAALEGLLEDPERRLREAALVGLGLLGDGAAFDALVGTMTGRDATAQERSLAAVALGMLGGEQAIDPLTSNLGEGVRQVKRGSTKEVDGPRALGLALLDRADATSELARLWLKLRSKRLKGQDTFGPMALTALARSSRHLVRERDLTTPVTEALVDRSERELARSAAILLGRLLPADDGPTQKVVRRLDHIHDEMTRRLLMISLGRAKAPVGLGRLRKIVEDDRDDDDRAFAALGLGVAQDTVAAPGLRKLFEKETRKDTLRGALAVALGLLGDQESAPLLRAALAAERNEDAQADLVYGLLLLRDTGARALVHEAASRAREGRLMRAACLYLATVGEPGLGELTAMVENAAQLQLKGEAAVALGRTRRAAAVAPLVAIATGQNRTDHTRACALIALGHLASQTPDALSRISRDVNFTIEGSAFIHELLDLF